MAENSKIEWCDSTFNPWIGCTNVGPGCDHCYAEALMDKRWRRVQWGIGKPRERTSAANWKQPLLWEKEHDAFALMHGRRRRVFCASLADVFDNQAPAAWRAELFALIGLTPHLDWLLLTKRIGNVKQMLEQPGMPKDGMPSNVWLGATVVNQEEADRDIPKLLAVPARVRFLSIEPMLGPICIERATDQAPRPPRRLPYRSAPPPVPCTRMGCGHCATSAKPSACHSFLSSLASGAHPWKAKSSTPQWAARRRCRHSSSRPKVRCIALRTNAPRLEAR